MPLSTQIILRSVENEQNGDNLRRPNVEKRRTTTADASDRSKEENSLRRSSRGSKTQSRKGSPAFSKGDSATNSLAENSGFVTPVPPSARPQRRVGSRLRRVTSPFIEPPSFEYDPLASSNDLTIEERESTPGVIVRGERRSLSRQSSRLSTASSSSHGSQAISTTDPIFPDEKNDISMPHEYSTFFESSTLDNNRACNLLKPKFVAPTNFFPGDDIDEDIPWIGKISKTYSRKRRQSGSTAFSTRFVPQDSDESSHSEGEDLLEVEIRMANDKALKNKSKRKRPFPLPPGFNEWSNRTNVEFNEVEKHQLTVEELPNKA